MADEIHESEGIDAGRIKDPQVAHDLANKVQAGWKKALKAEQVLTEKLTDEQKEQLRIVESLPGKYPHAFVPDEDGSLIRISEETGLRYLLTRPSNDWNKDRGSVVVFSQYGYSMVGRAGGFTARELSQQDFSVVFVDDGKHKREKAQTGDGELIEFPVVDGKAFYKAYGKSGVTEKTAPILKVILSLMEKDGLIQGGKEAKEVDVVNFL